jgi:serine/threonine protein phosphatase PrpC
MGMETVLLDDFVKARLIRAIADGQATRAIKASGAISIGTSVGAVRDENQDAALCMRARFGNEPGNDFDLLILCDGMGGMRGGREASSHAIARFIFTVMESRKRPFEALMNDAMRAANDSLYRKFGGSGGTTLSAVVLQRGREAIGTHAGDSRIYTVSDDGALDQVSQDDTLSSLLNRGSETEHGSKLVQFVGMGGDLEPHTYRLALNGQRILLTSDGVHGVAPSTLSRLARYSLNSHDMIRKLLTLSDVLGGWDNATAIVAGSQLESPPVEGLSGCFIEIITPLSSFEILLPDRSMEHRNTATNVRSAEQPLAPSPQSAPPSQAGGGLGPTATTTVSWWARSFADRSQVEPVIQAKKEAPAPSSPPSSSASTASPGKGSSKKEAKGAAIPKKRKTRGHEKSEAEKQLELKAPPSVSVEFPDEGDDS